MFPQHITIQETIAAVSLINLIIAFISSKYRSFLFWCISRWTYAFIRKTYVHRGLGDAFIAHLMKSGYKSKKFTGELYGEDVAFIRSEGEAKHILYRDFHSNTQLFLRKGSWPLLVSGSSLVGKANEVRAYDYIIYSLRWTVDIAKLLDEATESKNAPEPNEEEVNKFVVKRVSGSKFYKEAPGQDSGGNQVRARLDNGGLIHESILADEWSAFVPYKYAKSDIGEVYKQQKKTMDMMSLTPELEDLVDEIDFFVNNKAFYEERSIPYKRSFLFTGPPGTGKTLMCRALAEHFNMPVVLFDLSSMTNGDLIHAYNQLLSNKLVVFEDIDAVFHGRENITGSDLTFDTFLNVLDGVEKKQGIIHILTTNHPELLDEALCEDMTDEERIAGKIPSRPQRIDRSVLFKGLDEAGRRKLIMRIVRDEAIADKLMIEGKDMSAAQLTELAFRAAVGVLWAQRKKDKEAAAITKTQEGL